MSHQLINGRYTLHEKIGQGGMGIVYRATDRLAGQTIALKQVFVPVSQLFFASRSAAKSLNGLRLALANEFRTLASMRHPHIISVLDYGFDEEKRPFFTMPLLRDARTILQAGYNRSVPEKVQLLQQMLEAIAYLHRRGILHRDLKPDNVLVVNDTVRVLDFGLATAAEQATGSVGSWQYMAPEVLQGQAATETGDLYAVGVLAYQLFVHEHPFRLEAEDLRHEILSGEPQWDKLVVEEQLKTVIRTLLAKDPAQRPQTAAEAIVAFNYALGQEMPEETAVIRESYLQAATFVGRDKELSQLQTALAQTQTSPATVWLLGGESGVGKSRLLDEVRTYALVSRWQVLSGQAILENGMPYQLWQEIVPRLALNTKISDLEVGILQEIYPALDTLLGRKILPAPELSGEAGEQRLVLTLVELLKRQSEPTLLLLEDLQWAQRGLGPLQQILNIANQLSGVMVIGTYRNDECPDLPAALPGSNILSLARLSDDEIRQLSQSMLGRAASTPKVVTWLKQETEGNTFFIIEVIRALAEEAGHLADVGQLTLPDGILTRGMSTLLERRLQSVPLADQPLLQLTAVAGRQVDEQVLQALAPDIDTKQWLQQTTEAAVLAVRDNQWQFSHDKLREAILAQLPPEELCAAHRQVAQALEQVYRENARYYPRLLAHWQAAEDNAKELQYLLPVVRQVADVSGDYSQGHKLALRGLQLLSATDRRRVMLLNLRANAFAMQSKFAEAENLAQAAYTLARQLHEPTEEAKSLNVLGHVACEQSQYSKAHNYFQRSLAVGQMIEDDKSVANSFVELGVVAEFQKEYVVAKEYFEQSLSLYQMIGDRLGCSRSFFYLGLLAAQHDNDYTAALDYFHQSLSMNEAIGNQRNVAKNLNSLGIFYATKGDYPTAHDYFEQSLMIRQGIGDYAGLAHTHLVMGEAHFFEGIDYELVLHYQEQSLQQLLNLNALALIGINYGYITLSHLALGNYEAALENVLSHFERHATIETDKSNGMVHVAVAKILAACGVGQLAWAPVQEQVARIALLTQLETTPQAYIERAIEVATISQIRLVVLVECGRLAAQLGYQEAANTYLTEAKLTAAKMQNQDKQRQIEVLLNCTH